MAELFVPDGWIWQQLRQSGDRYVFDAVKQGYTPDWRERIPKNIAGGLDTTTPDLLERRKDWNTKTPEPFALPTEIWRKTIERLQRCEDILGKIKNGKITSINDFITYNLDIRQFAIDLINADDASQSFIYNFYDALRSVTILDPTCGSGAFLFAAMNILEPLYYDCIMRLESIERKSPDTQKALDEIKSKYRSNIHYFIYKSIILRNLCGVDIMAEATEIAKLRLFLKMVAVVDVQPLADNLGLDPLPDIDFNIRCGNTLVGYANAESIVRDHNGDMFAKHDFEENVAGEMDKVARTFKLFKHLQFTQESEHHEEFIVAKRQLGDLLTSLNDTLNHHLHNATASGIPYEEWLTSHQPFNWVAKFYDIIHGNGGFDVIIGNPPYGAKVERQILDYYKQLYNCTKSNKALNIKGSSDTYVLCIERCMSLLHKNAPLSFIVPLGFIASDATTAIQNIIRNKCSNIHVASFAVRPKPLFENAMVNTCIIRLSNDCEKCKYLYSTHIYRRSEGNELPLIFSTIKYINVIQFNFRNRIPKISLDIEMNILEKINGCKTLGSFLVSYGAPIVYKFAGGRYFKLITTYTNNSSAERTIYVDKNKQSFIAAVLSSNLSFLIYQILSDNLNWKGTEIEATPIPVVTEYYVIDRIYKHYVRSIENNANIRSSENSSNYNVSQFKEYKIGKSKKYIDEIDKVLARHYGFTDEELDFIINYDIKYRIGDELNNEE